jgi:glycerol uptake facilitator-like aquaporin
MALAYGILGANKSLDMHPSDERNTFYLLIAEFIFSLIFLTIYMYAKNDWVSPSMDFGLRAFTMMGIQYLSAALSLKITGGALNPSIGFCAVLFSLMVRSGDTVQTRAIFLIPYLLGPILAGAVAGLYLRHFAIKVTPPTPASHGSPFL